MSLNCPRLALLSLLTALALSPAAQAFLDYAMSAEAAPVIESAGVVPANG